MENQENKNLEKEKQSNALGNKKIAAIRLRGNVTIKTDFERTLQMLRLYKRNFCVIVPKTPAYIGMIEKVKDHITWGEIDEQTLKELQEKRGEGNKKFYRLNSPRGGLGRRGIKAPFSKAGALGYRGAKINDLIKKMI